MGIKNFFVNMAVKKIDWNRPLAEVREALEKTNKELKLPKDVERTSISQRGVQGEWYTPKDAPPEKVIIYLHGGGYALGIYDTTRGLAANIAKESGIKVLLLNYSLAPEDPYPTALEDSINAFRWLLDEQNIKPEKIAYVTDSSGGSLGLATLASIRDMIIGMPCAIALMSPAVDFKRANASHKTKAGKDPYHTKPDFHLENYYIGTNDPANPMISPIYGSFKEFPPMLIHASDADVFLDDSIKLAEKAKSAGIEATTKVWPGMIHSFQMADSLSEARLSIREICAFVKGKIK